MMGIKEGLLLQFIIFFDKKSASLTDKSVAGGGVANNEIKQKFKLAEELQETIIRKLKKRKIYSGFKDNIWGADLADMQLISKFNKGFRFLFCVIDIFSKYAWVVRLKDKKCVSIVDAFQKIFHKPGRKPKKVWVDKGREFYNSSYSSYRIIHILILTKKSMIKILNLKLVII